jgi:hypothetical protein
VAAGHQHRDDSGDLPDGVLIQATQNRDATRASPQGGRADPEQPGRRGTRSPDWRMRPRKS